MNSDKCTSDDIDGFTKGSPGKCEERFAPTITAMGKLSPRPPELPNVTTGGGERPTIAVGPSVLNLTLTPNVATRCDSGRPKLTMLILDLEFSVSKLKIDNKDITVYDILQLVVKGTHTICSMYLRPTDLPIDPKCSELTNLKRDETTGGLLYNGRPVPTITKEKALTSLISFLKAQGPSAANLIVSHGQADPIALMHLIMESKMCEQFSEVIYAFGDTVPIIQKTRGLTKEGETILGNLAKYYNIPHDPHNAENDVVALETLMKVLCIKPSDFYETMKMFSNVHKSAAKKRGTHNCSITESPNVQENANKKDLPSEIVVILMENQKIMTNTRYELLQELCRVCIQINRFISLLRNGVIFKIQCLRTSVVSSLVLIMCRPSPSIINYEFQKKFNLRLEDNIKCILKNLQKVSNVLRDLSNFFRTSFLKLVDVLRQTSEKGHNCILNFVKGVDEQVNASLTALGQTLNGIYEELDREVALGLTEKFDNKSTCGIIDSDLIPYEDIQKQITCIKDRIVSTSNILFKELRMCH